MPLNQKIKLRATQPGQDHTTPPTRANRAGQRIPVHSERVATVARWFGLTHSHETNPTHQSDRPSAPVPLPAAGTILLLTGPSGGGKSRLLADLRRTARRRMRWINLATLHLPRATPLVDCFGDAPLREILLLLARVGLGEAWTYLRTPEQLSEGQRFRFRLALGLHAALTHTTAPASSNSSSPILVCDEFAAVLDRVTAMVVARCLRRTIDAHPRLRAIVATSHDDLQPALKPNTIAWCDFGRVDVQENK